MSSYIAGKMASKKAEGMLAPLMESDDESSTSSDEGSDASSQVETVKKSPMEKLKTLVVYVALGGAAVASVGAMVIAPAAVVFVTGGLCLANVPYSAFKERQLGKIPSLRSMNNKLREQANNLTEQVDILSEEIDALEPEADKAAEVEQKLQGIAEKQNFNVNKLVDLVKENGEILVQMRNNLRQRIVQDIIAIVVKSDRDNDNSIDKSEAKTLALRIRLSLQEYGVVFDIEKFLKAIGDAPTVQKVIGIVQKLVPAEKNDDDDESDSDSDEEDDVYDMFYMADEVDEGGDAKAGPHGVSLMKVDKHKSKRSLSADITRKSHSAGALSSAAKQVAAEDSDDDY